jgi:hypothetical protein
MVDQSLAGNSSDRIQLPDCDLRQVAWQQISVHHAVSIRPSELNQTQADILYRKVDPKNQ